MHCLQGFCKYFARSFQGIQRKSSILHGHGRFLQDPCKKARFLNQGKVFNIEANHLISGDNLRGQKIISIVVFPGVSSQPQYADLFFQGNIRDECNLNFDCTLKQGNTPRDINNYTGENAFEAN